MEEIKIYTSKDCGICTQTKDELIKNKIEFIEKDVDKFEKEFIEIVGFTNMPQTPTVYYKENYFVAHRDFNSPQALIEILQKFKKSNFTIEKQNYEKLKTSLFIILNEFKKIDEKLSFMEIKLDKLVVLDQIEKDKIKKYIKNK